MPAGTTAAASANPATVLPGLVALPANPNLSVATVKLEAGTRASKIIGARVLDASQQQVGSVDDLILGDGNRATLAIIAVGGFYGVGSKLIAVSFVQLKRDGNAYTLPGATKESLNAMPNFQY